MRKLFFTLTLLCTSCTHLQSTKSQEKTVFILGSFHDLNTIKGSDELFERVLRKIEPDVVFIEWPTSWFDKDGQIKKNYVVPTFKRKDVEVAQLFQGMYDNSDYKGYDSAILGRFVREKNLQLVPFDIANRNKITHNELGSRKLVGEFFKKLPDIKNPVAKVGWAWRESLAHLLKQCNMGGLPTVNSQFCDTLAKEFYHYQKVLLVNLEKQKVDTKGLKMSVDWWSRRRKAMAKNVCEATNQLKFKRALIHMGWHHRYHILEDLEKCKNFKIVHLWKDLPK